MVLFSALIKALMQQLLNRRFTKSYDVIIVLWELLEKKSVFVINQFLSNRFQLTTIIYNYTSIIILYFGHIHIKTQYNS